MSALDPRLAPVLAAERGIGIAIAVLGALMVLVGGIFMILGVTQGKEIGDMIGALTFGAVFLAPGVLMIRSWLRGPQAKASVRLLTSERADLAGWDLQYVSINQGPVRPRIVLKRRSGKTVQVTLNQGEEKQVVAYVAEIAPRLPQSGG